MEDAILRVVDLRKVYPAPRVRRVRGVRADPTAAPPPAVVALDGLDFEVRRGECFGLLGPNGAGKTTAIGILTTRVRATSGSAEIGGADVATDPAGVKRRIGVVPQQPNPDRSLSVRENLLFHAAYFGIAADVAGAAAGQLLAEFELTARADARVDQLSGGQLQRLMIARALIHQPEVLFLDEPTVGLDPQARLALWEILRRIHAEGRTIILTTHYMEEADRLCDRVAIVDRGKLLALDTPAALKQRAPGGTLVEVTLADGATALAEVARGLAGVARVEAEGDRLRLYADRPGEVLAALVVAAERAGHGVRHIHLAPPSLETYFLALTGRTLE